MNLTQTACQMADGEWRMAPGRAAGKRHLDLGAHIHHHPFSLLGQGAYDSWQETQQHTDVPEDSFRGCEGKGSAGFPESSPAARSIRKRQKLGPFLGHVAQSPLLGKENGGMLSGAAYQAAEGRAEKENMIPSSPTSPLCLSGRGRGRRRSSQGALSAVRMSRDSLSPFQILSSSQEYEQLPRGHRHCTAQAGLFPASKHSLNFDVDPCAQDKASHDAASPLQRSSAGGGVPQDLEAFASTPPSYRFGQSSTGKDRKDTHRMSLSSLGHGDGDSRVGCDAYRMSLSGLREQSQQHMPQRDESMAGCTHAIAYQTSHRSSAWMSHDKELGCGRPSDMSQTCMSHDKAGHTEGRASDHWMSLSRGGSLDHGFSAMDCSDHPDTDGRASSQPGTGGKASTFAVHPWSSAKRALHLQNSPDRGPLAAQHQQQHEQASVPAGSAAGGTGVQSGAFLQRVRRGEDAYAVQAGARAIPGDCSPEDNEEAGGPAAESGDLSADVSPGSAWRSDDPEVPGWRPSLLGWRMGGFLVPQVQCTWTEDPALGDQRRISIGDASGPLAFAEAAGAGAGVGGGGHGGGRSTGRRKSIAGATELEEVRRRLFFSAADESADAGSVGSPVSKGSGLLTALGLPQVHLAGGGGTGGLCGSAAVGGGEGVGGVPVVCQVMGGEGEGRGRDVRRLSLRAVEDLMYRFAWGCHLAGREDARQVAVCDLIRGSSGMVAHWHSSQDRDTGVRECAQGKEGKGGGGAKKEKKGKTKSSKAGASKSASKGGARAGGAEGEGGGDEGNGDDRDGEEPNQRRSSHGQEQGDPLQEGTEQAEEEEDAGVENSGSPAPAPAPASGPSGTPGTPAFEPKKVYVGGLPYDCSDEDIAYIFEECGRVEEIERLTFPDSGRFRGIAFLTFQSGRSARKALDMDGHQWEGRYLRVQKCRVKQGSATTGQAAIAEGSNAAGSGAGAGTAGAALPPPAKTEGYLRAYIGNLSYGISEEEVIAFFSGCRVRSVRLARDEATGKCRGFGHVDFEDDASLESAVSRNQERVLGRPMKVAYAVTRKDGGAGTGRGAGGALRHGTPQEGAGAEGGAAVVSSEGEAYGNGEGAVGVVSRKGEAGGGGGSKKGKMRRQFPVEIEGGSPSGGGNAAAKGVRKGRGVEGAQGPSPVLKKRRKLP